MEANKRRISRRDIIKGLATVPVAGALLYSWYRKEKYDLLYKEAVREEVTLDALTPVLARNVPADRTIRLGIIGTGGRGRSLLKAAGFLNPEIIDSYLPDGDEPTLRAWRVWADLWAEGMRDTELQEMNERLYGQWRQLVAEVIRQAQALGQARPGDPVQLADMLISMIDGLAMQSLLHSTHVNHDSMRNICRAFIDDMISSR